MTGYRGKEKRKRKKKKKTREKKIVDWMMIDWAIPNVVPTALPGTLSARNRAVELRERGHHGTKDPWIWHCQTGSARPSNGSGFVLLTFAILPDFNGLLTIPVAIKDGGITDDLGIVVSVSPFELLLQPPLVL